MRIKVISFLFILCIFPVLFANKVRANDLEYNDGSHQIIEVTDEAISVDLSVIGQNYPDKDVTLKAVIKTKTDIARAEIFWLYNTTLFMNAGSVNSITELKAGKEYTFYQTYKIKNVYKFRNVEKFDFGLRINGSAYDNTYLITTKETVTFNSQYEVIPFAGDYTTQKRNVTILNTILIIFIFAIIGVLSYFGIKRFKQYLDS